MSGRASLRLSARDTLILWLRAEHRGDAEEAEALASDYNTLVGERRGFRCCVTTSSGTKWYVNEIRDGLMYATSRGDPTLHFALKPGRLKLGARDTGAGIG